MTRILTFLLLALTASAQTWTNPTPQMMAMSNAVAFQSTAPFLYYSNGVPFGSLYPMVYVSWDWSNSPNQTEPASVSVEIQENNDLTTTNWFTVFTGSGTNCFLPATNQMGFFRATATYSTQ